MELLGQRILTFLRLLKYTYKLPRRKVVTVYTQIGSILMKMGVCPEVTIPHKPIPTPCA